MKERWSVLQNRMVPFEGPPDGYIFDPRYSAGWCVAFGPREEVEAYLNGLPEGHPHRRKTEDTDATK